MTVSSDQWLPSDQTCARLLTERHWVFSNNQVEASAIITSMSILIIAAAAKLSCHAVDGPGSSKPPERLCANSVRSDSVPWMSFKAGLLRFNSKAPVTASLLCFDVSGWYRTFSRTMCSSMPSLFRIEKPCPSGSPSSASPRAFVTDKAMPTGRSVRLLVMTRVS